MKYLDKIKSPQDVKKLSIEQLAVLADEMRDTLIEKISKHGGHLGANLGFVEATAALHYVFNSPQDKMVFDVSHQTYCHKMLTGRAEAFWDEAHYDDVTGYSNPRESEHDIFTIGHTSTSLSLASGLARARDLAGGQENVIAVIGDGSLSGGEALEGLDFIAEQNTNLIIVLNDNEMSISNNHGGIYKNLQMLRETNGQAECNMFKAWGLDYLYIEDGHDVGVLVEAFQSVKGIDHAIVVHIHTKKGKGLYFAEVNPENYHASMPFNVENGMYENITVGEDYSTLIGNYLMKKMKEDSSVVALNAATPTVIGFNRRNRKKAGRQFIDAGITEEHVAAMASGIAKYGGKPVWGVYSTFIQRTFDQISHDICLNNSPVTILNFSASIKYPAQYMNSATHLGIFDIPLLSNIPNLVYLAPVTAEELFAMLEWSIEQQEYPVAIRVPIDVVHTDEMVELDYSNLNKYLVTQQGSDVAVIAVGSFYQLGEEVVKAVSEKNGCQATLINPRYLTGIDLELLETLKQKHNTVITLEDGILDGGFGEKIARYYGSSKMKVYNYGFRKEFIGGYEPERVMQENGITVEQIIHDICEK